MVDLMRYFPVGRENAKSRYKIAQEACVSERAVRRYISSVNLSGRLVILPDPDMGGYYIPEEKDKRYLDIYCRQELHRAKEIIDKVNAIRGKHPGRSKQCDGQISLFGGVEDG